MSSQFNTDPIVIVSGCRTAIGNFSGSLKDLKASDLGSIVIKNAVERAGLSPNDIDEVVMGCVGQIAEDTFLARFSSVKAGIPYDSTAITVNRLCASGLQAIVTAAQEISCGFCEVAVAGGAESMSNYPYYVRNARFGYRMGHGEFEDGLVTALTDPFSGKHMGITAENVAARYHISREEQDRLAVKSQQRAVSARESGKFVEEIVPVTVLDGKKSTKIFDVDEYIRPAVTMENLGKLRPAFMPDGTVTAGNSSGINDGAAAVVVMRESKARVLDITPMVKIVSAQVAGVQPEIMGIGPIAAVNKLYQATGLTKEDIGLFELNEAFAAQAAACIKELELDDAIVNVNGSGMSLGHPIGATGCVIAVKLINEMRRRQVEYGIASLCIGGGQGLAVLFELCA